MPPDLSGCAIGVLGPVAVWHGGTPVHSGGPKQRGVLATLTLGAGSVVPTARIIDVVWGAGAPDGAHKTLQVYTSKLRHLLAAGDQRATITAVSSGYRLDIDQDAIDLFQFRSLVEQAGHQRRTNPRASLAAYERADRCWRGAPLEDLVGLGGVDGLLHGLREERARTLDRWFDLAIESGVSSPLISAIEDDVRIDPHREHRWAQLMVALYADGRQVEAVRCLTRLGTLLREDLGMNPGVAVQSLEGLILNQRPMSEVVAMLVRSPGAISVTPAAPAPPATELPPTLATSATVALAGRTEEVEEALAVHRLGSRLRSVTVAGPAGIGKSVVLAHVALQAREEGAAVFAGACDPDRIVPFLPFVDVVGQWSARFDAATRSAVLGSLEEDLLHLLPQGRATPAATVDPELRRHRVLEAVTELLLHVARTQPVLLVVDDVQWADGQTSAMLQHLGRRAAAADITVLVGVREDGEPVTTPALGDHRRIELGGLAERDMVTLVQHCIGSRWESIRPELAGALESVTSGNPFFATELLSVLAHSSVADPIDLADLVATYGIPVGLKHVLGRRFEQVGGPTTDLLRVAAVIGGEFDVNVLQPASDRPVDEVLSMLDDATRSGVVVEVRGALDRFRFRHDLARIYLLSTMTDSRRTRLHQQVAAIVGPGREGAPIRFHHLIHAGARSAVAELVEAGLAAGTAALDSGSLEDAEGIASQVIAIIEERCDDDAGRAAAHVLRGHARFGIGASAEAAADFSLARELALSSDRPDLLVESVVGPQSIGHDLPYDPTTVATIDQALVRVGHADADARVRLLCAAVYERMHGGHLASQRALVAEAEALAEAEGSIAARGLVAMTHHLVLVNSNGDLAEREAVIERALQHGTDAGDQRLVVRALGCSARGALEHSVDVYGERLEAFRRGAGELRHPLYEWFARAMEATQRFVLGDLDAADAAIHEAFEFGAALKVGAAMASYSAQLYMVRLAQGRLGELAPILELMVADQPEFAVWRLGWGRALADLGDLDRAGAQLEASVACGFRDIPQDWLFLSTLGTASELAEAVGHRTAARQIRDLLAPAEGQIVVAGNAIACHGPAARYLGLLDRVVGDRDDARRRFAAAERSARAIGLTYWADLAAADLLGTP